MADMDPLPAAASPPGAVTDAPQAPGAPAADPPAAATGAPPTPIQRNGRVLLAVAAILAVVALLWPRGDGSREAPGGFLVDAGGRPAPLAERMAPVTLLHFYASWCPPCLDEAPSMTRLKRDLASQPRFRVLMVAVNDDIQRAQALAGADDVLFDPQWEIAHRYGTRALPESYLIVGGKVKRKWDGPVDWDDPLVRDALQQAIAAAG